ncbi:MAG: molybdopterin biosynthesis protein, partial [Deltaproteobacteria bacterium]|nr:molybdopterin biosynthesis protein [Deltaproteobacteria bacterium]
MKQRQFLQTVERDEAERRFREALGELPELASDVVPVAGALGRVLAADVVSPVDVPGFDRSNMDGWAVRAADTYGASEAQPRRLVPAPQAVVMGAIPTAALEPGQAMAIPTGGPVPRGADGVVMVEDTEVIESDDRETQVEIRRAITPGSHVTFAGTDIARGETVLRRGAELTSRELGVLAALGLAEVEVRCRPRVAILSTGDELVPLGEPIVAGQVYDSNATILAAAVQEQGGLPELLGITPDDVTQLSDVLCRAIADYDVVLLSGGTSKGPGDVNGQALRAVTAPPGIVVHGVALKPGKPLCLAVSGKTPVVVLP